MHPWLADLVYFFVPTAKANFFLWKPSEILALHRKFETNIPRNETAQPRSQFLHSCISEQFIHSHDRSAYFAVLRLRTDCGNIKISHRNKKLGTRPRSFISRNICSEFSVSAFAVCGFTKAGSISQGKSLDREVKMPLNCARTRGCHSIRGFSLD